MSYEDTGSLQKDISRADLFLEDLENNSLLEKPNGLLDQKKWLFEQRFHYGIEFFKFHADQRMKMFQFFLIFVGLFAPAYATLLTNGYRLTSSFLAVATAVLTIGFVHLERRNEELVHIAEDVLASLEADVLFAKYIRPIPWPRRRNLLGKMGSKDLTDRTVGIFQREAADIYGKVREQKDKNGDDPRRKCPEPSRSPHEHGKWLSRLQGGILIMFFCLAILPWIRPQVTICGYTIDLRVETKK